MRSVPIKPIGRYRVEGLWANRADFPLSRRSAAAIAASAIANTARGYECVVGHLGRNLLEDAGVLTPLL